MKQIEWNLCNGLLNDIEEHLDITIDRVGTDIDVPVNEFDGKVTYGQKRKAGVRAVKEPLILPDFRMQG
nr:hypothetical protein BaRGS_029789 [Batillaria attramentaria]